MTREKAMRKRDIIVTQFINELGVTIETNTKPLARCEECKYRDPENKRCDCGALERQGCKFPVNDEYFCLYGERSEYCEHAKNPSGDVWECGCFLDTYCEHQIYDRNPDGTLNIVKCGERSE